MANKIGNIANEIGQVISNIFGSFFEGLFEILGNIGTFLWELPGNIINRYRRFFSYIMGFFKFHMGSN